MVVHAEDHFLLRLEQHTQLTSTFTSLLSLPSTAPVLARNGPLRVQPFNTLLSLNLIVDPSGLRNPSAKPHTPPIASPAQ